jgi:hypothetical protein
MNVNNFEDVIDSREVIDRIEELENEIELADVTDDMEDEREELEALKDLAEQCENMADWTYGEALIRRSYWEEYVEELLKDCGDLPQDLPWYIAIDWGITANNIEADYASVDFDGVEYLIRDC